MHLILSLITVPLLLNATIGFWFIFGFGEALNSSALGLFEEPKKVETWKEMTNEIKTRAQKELFTPRAIVPGISAGGGLLANTGIIYAIYPYLSEEQSFVALGIQLLLFVCFAALGAISGGLQRQREARKIMIKEVHTNPLP